MKSKGKSGATHRNKTDWHATTDKMRKKLESAWKKSEHSLESLWHQSAVATLHWVGANKARVQAFRNSVKNTPVEKAMNAALKAIRAEARAKARTSKARRRPAARKATSRPRAGAV